MRNKREIMAQLLEMNNSFNAGKLNEFQFRMLQEAIKIEVQTDIRDLLTKNVYPLITKKN